MSLRCRLRIGGRCGNREVGGETRRSKARGALPRRTFGTRQDKSVADRRESDTRSSGARWRAATDRLARHAVCMGWHESWRCGRLAVFKIISHPTDALAMQASPRESKSPGEDPFRPRGSKPRHSGPSRCKEPFGALSGCEKPPNRDQDPLCHLLPHASVGSCGQVKNQSKTRKTLCSGVWRPMPRAPYTLHHTVWLFLMERAQTPILTDMPQDATASHPT
jgi:hypothetical protein